MLRRTTMLIGLLTFVAVAGVAGAQADRDRALIAAAGVEIVRELLKTPIAIDHVNRLGWTALLEAIILGDGGPRHTEVVRLLVDAGAGVNIADGGGMSPLAHARARGFAPIISLLEAKGAR